MDIEQIRELSRQYAQRPCMTPNEFAEKQKRDKQERWKRRVNRDPVKAKRRYANGYLRTDHWIEFRASILAARGRKCEQCGSERNIQVHHLTYRRKGSEKPEDVKVLCNTCHVEAHAEARRKKAAAR